jgi:hypothetical protein
MSKNINQCEGLDLGDPVVRSEVFRYISVVRHIGDKVFEVTDESRQRAESIGATQYTRETAPQKLVCAHAIVNKLCTVYEYLEPGTINGERADFLVQHRDR